MAIYHCTSSVIQRSKGRNVVAAAAYRACTKLLDERQGIEFDYSAKSDLVRAEIFIPNGAPDWMSERQTLWNRLDALERQWNGQTAREIQVALPVELTAAQNWQLAQAFAQQFTEQGMIADVAFHKGHGKEQPHLHILLSMREVLGNDFSKTKNRVWNERSWYQAVRVHWQDLANQHLALNGIDATIDHRSNVERGIDLIPQGKIGISATRAKRDIEQGKNVWESERMVAHAEIARTNGERISANPLIAIDALSRSQSTFSDADIARFAHRHSGDAAQFTTVYQSILGCEQLVTLGKNSHGERRYTAQQLLDIETTLLNDATAMADTTSHRVRSALVKRVSQQSNLTVAQSAVLNELTTGRDCELLVGFAGTGKTHVLGAATKAWQQSGFTVRGLALSGKAADGLRGVGMHSKTLALQLIELENERDTLTKKDVLLIDEAGMVDSRQLGRIVQLAKTAGAKIVLAGDHTQLQPIGAGAAFRALGQHLGTSTLTDVTRQSSPWMQDASKAFALGQSKIGLAAYQAHGMVHQTDTHQAALLSTVNSWWQKQTLRSTEISIMAAYRRADVLDLNLLAREKLQRAGKLGADITLPLFDGRTTVERKMTIGESVMFLKNDNALNVRNGTQGVITAINESQLHLQITEDKTTRTVKVNLADYNAIDYAYASTVHKLQGMTVDHMDYFPSWNNDRTLSNVAMTRHRKTCHVHWSEEDFRYGQWSLESAFSRERIKDFTADYSIERQLTPLADVDGFLMEEVNRKTLQQWQQSVDWQALANTEAPQVMPLVDAKCHVDAMVNQFGADEERTHHAQAQLMQLALDTKEAHLTGRSLQGLEPAIIDSLVHQPLLTSLEKGVQHHQQHALADISAQHDTDTMDATLASFDWAGIERSKDCHEALTLLSEAKSYYSSLDVDASEKQRHEAQSLVQDALTTLSTDTSIYQEVTRLEPTLVEPLNDLTKRQDKSTYQDVEPSRSSHDDDKGKEIDFDVINSKIDWEAIETLQDKGGALGYLLEAKQGLDRAKQMDKERLITVRQEQIIKELDRIARDDFLKNKVVSAVPSLDKAIGQANQARNLERSREHSHKQGLGL